MDKVSTAAHFWRVSCIVQLTHSATGERAAVSDPDEPLSLRARAALWLTLAFWGSDCLFLIVGSALSDNGQLIAIFGTRALSALLGVLFCCLLHRLLALPAFSETNRRLLLLALVAPLAAAVFAWASMFAEISFASSLGLGGFTSSTTVRSFASWTWFFLAWAGLQSALTYSFDLRDEQGRASKLEQLARAEQLRAQHSRINPHFLFNSLNAVSTLVLERNRWAAEDMVLKLVRFLRLGLAANPARKMPLRSEIELQRSYLEIEQLRYPDLLFVLSVPVQLQSALVPSLLLQPLVEDAVKKAIVGAPPPAVIRIQAKSANQRLDLMVIDSRKGSPEETVGLLASVRRRLLLIYGEGQFTVTAAPINAGRFKVQISIPLETI